MIFIYEIAFHFCGMAEVFFRMGCFAWLYRLWCCCSSTDMGYHNAVRECFKEQIFEDNSYFQKVVFDDGLLSMHIRECDVNQVAFYAFLEKYDVHIKSEADPVLTEFVKKIESILNAVAITSSSNSFSSPNPYNPYHSRGSTLSHHSACSSRFLIN